jgi:hypothetical protein
MGLFTGATGIAGVDGGVGGVGLIKAGVPGSLKTIMGSNELPGVVALGASAVSTREISTVPGVAVWNPCTSTSTSEITDPFGGVVVVRL